MAWNGIVPFSLKAKRVFDAVMEYDERENRILDYFGKPHILLSELHLEASSEGGLVITSGRQWLLIGGKKIPLPAWLCGSSTVYEAYDEEMNCFSIKVHVKIGYSARFSLTGDFPGNRGRNMLKRHLMVSVICFWDLRRLKLRIYQLLRRLFYFLYFFVPAVFDFAFRQRP